MNISYLKYAVEVARCGMLNKAAQKLEIAPSNLSHAIKELEKSLDIRIFERTPTGMALTLEGCEFIRRSESILTQVNEIEQISQRRAGDSTRFSASVPRASYICEAFNELIQITESTPYDLYYKETNSNRTIESLLNCSCDIGIIRSENKYDKNFFNYIAEKGLSSKIISEYRYVVVASKNSPLASRENINYKDLIPLSEIAFSDPLVPYTPTDSAIKTGSTENIKKHIYVIESMSAYSVITMNTSAFIWMTPLSDEVLERFGLIQRECSDHTDVHKDILVWRNGYVFSDIDRRFLDIVHKKAEECGIGAEV